MIDTKSAKWDFSKQERYVINFFNAHGFDGELKKHRRFVLALAYNGIFQTI